MFISSENQYNLGKQDEWKSTRNWTIRTLIQRNSISKNPRLPTGIPRLRLQQTRHSKKQQRKLQAHSARNRKTRKTRTHKTNPNRRTRQNVQTQHRKPHKPTPAKIYPRPCIPRMPKNHRTRKRKRTTKQTNPNHTSIASVKQQSLPKDHPSIKSSFTITGYTQR